MMNYFRKSAQDGKKGLLYGHKRHLMPLAILAYATIQSICSPTPVIGTRDCPCAVTPRQVSVDEIFYTNQDNDMRLYKSTDELLPARKP